jgi:uncharacterized coiled-coil protein SlyX
MLEERVTRLEELPSRVDAIGSQISQLRDDVGGQISQLGARVGGVEARIDALGARVSEMERTLREEIVAGDERILTQVRVLHEDVISRLVLIQEGQPRRRRRRN